jgi:hypothetical protein
MRQNMQFYCLNMFRAPNVPIIRRTIITSAFRWPYLESRLGFTYSQKQYIFPHTYKGHFNKT